MSQKQMDLSRSIGSIQAESEQAHPFSKSTIEHARNRPAKKPQHVDSLGSINLGESLEINPNPGLSAYENFYDA